MKQGFVNLYLLAGAALVALICLAIIARNWSCRGPRPPRPPRVVTVGPYAVQSVESGAAITVSTGRRDRRTTQVLLQYVQAPASGPDADRARDHLAEIAGDKITVQYERHGILRGDSPADASLPESPPSAEGADNGGSYETDQSPPEARGPLTGIVFGFSGIECNLYMINHGYADCTVDAPKQYRVARDLAKEDREGIWANEPVEGGDFGKALFVGVGLAIILFIVWRMVTK